MNLHGRSFLTLKDYTKEEIRYLLDLAHQLKADKQAGITHNSLAGKNIVLLFEKTSTRTRCAFEVAAFDEGAQVTFLSNSQFGIKESVADTAAVLGQMYDGIEFRGSKQRTVEELAKYSQLPVWNGLTDDDHPTQTLADFMTIEEVINKPLNQVKFAFVGDIHNNVCKGLMYGAAKMGMDFICLGPNEIKIEDEVIAYCQAEFKKSGGSLTITDNLDILDGVDVIYTDVWVSMGEPDSVYASKIKILSPYKITPDLMAKTNNPQTIFMHCLPSFHDLETEVAQQKYQQGIDIRETSNEVFTSPNSYVFQEAGNRMHTIKAVMVATLGNYQLNK